MEVTQRGRQGRSKVVQRTAAGTWTMASSTYVNLLKFAPKETYIDDLMDGCLYMNAVGYYHGLPGEQGDPLEASLS